MDDKQQTLGEYLKIDTPEELFEDMTLGEFMHMNEAAGKGNEELENAVISILAARAYAAAFPAQEAQKHTEPQQEGAQDGAIHIRTKSPFPNPESVDPELTAQIKETVDRCGGIVGFKEQLEAKYAEYSQKLAEGIGEALTETQKSIMLAFKKYEPDIKQLVKVIGDAINAALDFANSEAYKAITATAAAIADYAVTHKEEMQRISEGARQLRELAPFIEAEIQAHPEYADLSTDEVLINGFYDDGTPIEISPFEQIIQGALDRQAKFNEGAAIVAEVNNIIQSPVKSLLYPLDKPNSELWTKLEAAKPDGQIRMGFDTTSRRPRKKGATKEIEEQAIIFYSLVFTNDDGVKITKQLNAFDKLVYSIVDALRRSGNKYVSLTQIYKVMNEGKTPSGYDLERIDTSLTKMGFARIYIDNKKEAELYPGYPVVTIDAPLLSFKRMTGRKNGKISEGFIEVLDDLPLMEFARGRKQVASISPRLLAAPVNKTDKNLRIQDYLLDRIGRMKGGKAGGQKMLYATIFDRCGISDSKPERTKTTIKKYLEHYKTEKWIKGYTESKDGVTIQL